MKKFDPKKFDDIDNEVGGVTPQPTTAPVINPKQAVNPNTAVTSQFNNAYTSYVQPQTKTATSQTQPQSPSPQSLPAPQPASVPTLPPPAAASSTPASPKKPVDASRITKQYDTMSKIVNDPNAPKGEKDAAEKKMSEFEKKYQEIINKYKTAPTAPATAPAPAAAPRAATTAAPATAPQQRLLRQQ